MRVLQLLVVCRTVRMASFQHLSFILILFYIVSSVLCVDYCQIEREKCASLPHIGCNETTVTFEVNPNCSNIQVIELKNSVKNYILDVHNELRDKLASGAVGNYPPASRMLEMFWDEELEATACFHVQYCMFEHDKCRATPSYKYPGQNIRISHYTNFPQTNIKKELYNGILDWFNEYADVKPSIVDRYENRPNHKQYGHFTAMAKDNNDRIGCCYITYEDFYQNTEVIEYSHLFTCNYRETNLINRPVYLKGNATSKCDDFGYGYMANDKQCPHLCTNALVRDELTLLNEPKLLETETIVDSETQYCEIGRTKCGRNKHIGCTESSGFELNENCMKIQVHNMTDMYQSVLLTENNKYRNLIASGTFNDFPAATKMQELEWDKQLEDVACEYVKYCQPTQPAECLATLDHDLPGQSVYHRYSDKKITNHAKILQEAVRNWFNQSSAASSDIIDNYQNVGTDYYGSFALMVRDAQSKIGCCFITYEENVNDYPWQSHLVSCVYENVNFLSTKIYEKGKPASECSKIGENYVMSDIYPNLCTRNTSKKETNETNEIFVENDINEENEEESLNEIYDQFEEKRPDFADSIVLSSRFDDYEENLVNVSHYCQLEIEKCEGRRHIGCESDPGLEINPECIDIEVVNITEKMKRMVINLHNSYRSAIAGGKVKGYPSASKMREVEWDSELADVACHHVTKCRMQNDECRATDSYDNPAQNFYGTYADRQQPNHTMVLLQGIRHWFQEHKQDAGSDIIRSYRTPGNSYRFLTMVRENNDKIGCCYIQNKFVMPAKTWYSHMFTCNYRENNERGTSVYAMGKPASECHQWGVGYKKSTVWNNLCVAST